MPFHLSPLLKNPPNSSGESDLYLLPTLSRIHLAAFLTAPFYRTLHPGPASTHPAIELTILNRHRSSLLDDPTCHFINLLHSAEPETGEPWKVIAFVKYRIFRTQSDLDNRSDTDTEKREWPEGTNLPFVREFWPRVADARTRYGGKLGPHVDIEILATDPDYHRMGAGRMLMDRVCKEADELGLQCYLEGTEEGRGLYEKCGFVGKEDLWLDLSRFEGCEDKGKAWRGEGAKEGVGKGWYTLLIMLRPAKGK